MSDSVPHNPEAEEAVLAGVVLNPAKVSELASDLDIEDFYIPRHKNLWAAWLTMESHGEKPDTITWAKESGVSTADILAITSNSIGFNRNHVEIIKQHKTARDVMAICFDIRARAGKREDPYELLEELQRFAVTSGSGNGSEPESMSLWDMAETAEASAPWIVTGALRKDWRAIVTGEEGAGKGTLLRCFALATAAGVHPFTHKPMEPHKTLMVDLENPKAAILETGLVLVETMFQETVRKDQEFYPDMCRFWHRPGGIDIRQRRDRAELEREIAAQRPELVCIGPWYKLARPKQGDNWEDAALAVLAILDDLRTKYGFALMIEAHSRKASAGQRRDMHPIGSVYLSAWPELGVGLYADPDQPTVLTAEHWRGARLQQRWPQQIMRDNRYVISGKWNWGTIDF